MGERLPSKEEIDDCKRKISGFLNNQDERTAFMAIRDLIARECLTPENDDIRLTVDQAAGYLLAGAYANMYAKYIEEVANARARYTRISESMEVEDAEDLSIE